VRMERDILGKAHGILRKRARSEVFAHYSTSHRDLADPGAVPPCSVSASLATHQHLARRRKIAQTPPSERRSVLLVHISAAYAENRGPTVGRASGGQLRTQGIRVGKLAGATADAISTAFRPAASGDSASPPPTSRHDLPIAPNLLNRNFNVARAQPGMGG